MQSIFHHFLFLILGKEVSQVSVMKSSWEIGCADTEVTLSGHPPT